MKGGFLFNPYHPGRITSNEDAVTYFQLNSKFSLLTNSSSASITFKATLKPEAVSPFFHTRSSIFGEEVKTLLFKYFLITPAEFGGTSADSKEVCLLYTHKIREAGRMYIESTTVAQIKHEYSIQLDIYQKTYNTISSANEPVCPYPISYSTDLAKDGTIQEIIGKLDPDAPDTANTISIIKDNLYGNIDTQADAAYISSYNTITRKQTPQPERGAQARQKITTLGCIIMEFMEGYITLAEYLEIPGLDRDARERALSLAAYELLRTRYYGFMHGDLYKQNIMYKSDHEYITTDGNDKGHKGRALLIDFSRSEINKQKQITEEDTWLTSICGSTTYKEYLDRSIVYDTKTGLLEFYLKFYGKYTFKYIYERRLKSSLKFREKMIDHFKMFIKNKDYSKPLLERSQSLITLETIQETVNDFIYPFLYPTPEFIGEDGEEFPDHFNKNITVLFVSTFGEIVKLQEDANNVLEALQRLEETNDLLSEQLEQLEQLEQTSKKQKTDALPYHKGLVILLRSVLLRREQRRKKDKLVCGSQGSQGEGGGRLINYDKNHKVYNKRFPHSLRVNQYNGRIRNTLKIKYRQTKKSKPKKSKPKKSKRKKRKLTKRKLTKRKSTKSTRKK